MLGLGEDLFLLMLFYLPTLIHSVQTLIIFFMYSRKFIVVFSVVLWIKFYYLQNIKKLDIFSARVLRSFCCSGIICSTSKISLSNRPVCKGQGQTEGKYCVSIFLNTKLWNRLHLHSVVTAAGWMSQRYKDQLLNMAYDLDLWKLNWCDVSDTVTLPNT